MAVVYAYISTGVGRLHVAYPSQGAMREPSHRDRRGERLTPTSFLFPINLFEFSKSVILS